MKIVLMSSGLVSLAVCVKYTLIPLIIQFTVYDLPTVCSVFRLMFKPPYLYLLFNGIILLIALISRFTQSQTQLLSPQLIPSPIPAQRETSHDIIVPPPQVVEAWDVKTAVVVDGVEVEEEEKAVVGEVDEVAEVVLPATEKPLLLTAFGVQKQSKLNPEGRNKVKVSKHKRHETLDSTWRMITEGKTRSMKNWDTFENNEKDQLNSSSVRQNSFFRKSATFKDRTNFLHAPPLSPGIVRKDPSLGKDELNHRVEAFIKKFNEEMRLQRQESYQRYLEMINHG